MNILSVLCQSSLATVRKSTPAITSLLAKVRRLQSQLESAGTVVIVDAMGCQDPKADCDGLHAEKMRRLLPAGRFRKAREP